MTRQPTMYLPALEHDACGMGFITQIDGKASHELIENALTMLLRMNHRGGTGAEPDTGDGAGILMALPDGFFQAKAVESGINLPKNGDYAIAMLFLPKEAEACRTMLQAVEEESENFGSHVLWQRDVPFVFENCGPGAQKAMPNFCQLFLKRPDDIDRGRPYEDYLFRLRRKLEKTFVSEEFTIVSLSSQTVCYKGMLHAYQVGKFFPDLKDERMTTSIALIHSRFSTNTFPSWNRAQPYRFLAHNGEINTLRGAENWMVSHNIEVYDEENTDSAKLENCMEYLYRQGRSIPQALMMMIPEAWSKEAQHTPEYEAFSEYNASFMSPWDGPAALCFTDGVQVGAALDRNGLRPSRYSLTKDNILIVASESGVVDLAPSDVVEKGVLGAAEMILVDTHTGKFYRNDEIKNHFAKKHPYQKWLDEGITTLRHLPDEAEEIAAPVENVDLMWRRFGYTDELLRTVLTPMAENGQEPLVSMGFDSPLAVLSRKNQSLFTYFKQQFAQVTNPPIDAIREKMVIGTEMFLGRDGDIAKDTAENCRKLKVITPVLSTEAFEKILQLKAPYQNIVQLSLLYQKSGRANSLEDALDVMFKQAEEAVNHGATILILSDRNPEKDQLILPSLLAVAGLHNYLVRKGKGGQASIVIDSAEITEVHHFALLLGYGASAVHPYGAYATLEAIGLGDKRANYHDACEKGIIKIMSRMGISTISGYHGAQLFEAVGIDPEVIDKYFTGTASRIGGLDLAQIEEEYLARYHAAYGNANDPLASGGSYQYRADGEHHLYNPNSIYLFQNAVRKGDYGLYKQFVAEMEKEAAEQPTNLRHLWELKSTRPAVPLEEVEPVSAIVKRFKAGAMSYGSLSEEAHETIAAAMNEIGGKSNSGEGGESRKRFKPQKDGTNLNSKIKQVASGRFGVNAEYLMSAEELQIKIAQGAKPGEGGQLPANKVFPWVAEIRGATPGVSLISPPPHHDIYSIEDLAQLIYDLKQVNPYARINVKLVSNTGVGTVAAGVVKAGADVVTISGYDGGTGASPRNSVRDAGLPWEMGLAETHQTLTLNRLRQRVSVETDGKLLTGRDIAIAALLGAEEFSFGTLTLISLGCIMMRVCNLNTCPVGVATQNPELRKFFRGKKEDLIHMMTFLAEDLREEMAALGYRTLDEMIGHGEHLKARFIASGKEKTLDFSKMLGHTLPIERKAKDPFKAKYEWPDLDRFAAAALESTHDFQINGPINNVSRTVGARMGGWIAQRFGNSKLAPGQIKYHYDGIAGQSFGAFIPQGMELSLTGEANDYVAKGLSGGRIIIAPPQDAAYLSTNNQVVGNVACFGASGGEAYFNGRAGERFCVRNSGAKVVVEGCGDHGCEYMTGGVAVVLGRTGRNFAAGMSGGIAYVYDPDDRFTHRCNLEMVDLFTVDDADSELEPLLQKHFDFTGSKIAKKILDDFANERPRFKKVYPKEYHHMLDTMARLKEAGTPEKELWLDAFEEAMSTAKGGH